MEPRSRHKSEFATSQTNLSEIEAILDAKLHPKQDRSRLDNRPVRMLVIEGGGPLPIIVQKATTLTIGRGDECGLSIPLDSRVSRVHCEIEHTADSAMIHDRNSTNGTFLNGRKIQSAKLFDGDRVLVGTTVLTIRVQYEARMQ